MCIRDSLTYSAPNFDEDSLKSNFKDISDDFSDYPSLIYDGPFSDHIMERESVFLKDQQETGKKQAREKASGFLELNSSDLQDETDSAGNLPTYNFSGEGLRISISKAGGYAVSFIKDRVVESAELGYEEASQAARAFMEQRGLADMQESYYVINDNICTINYAYAKDGVLYYPCLLYTSTTAQLVPLSLPATSTE